MRCDSNIQTIGIITNALRDSDFSKTDVINRLVVNYGFSALLFSDFTDKERFYDKVDAILTLGGDGTILRIASEAAKYGKPVIGVNIGNLGYLTDCSFENAEKTIANIKEGKFFSESRMMLEATIYRREDSPRESTYTCLNEVCIIRGFTSKIISFDLNINHEFVDNYNADGIIIATPTGSTAYNLSAGGPILMPGAKMMAITPICPHMLTTRPLVVSAEDAVTVRITSRHKETIVSVDGEEPMVVSFGDIIRIKRFEGSVNIIKTNDLGFYEILTQKLINVTPVDN